MRAETAGTMTICIRMLLAAVILAFAQVGTCYSAETVRVAVQKTGTFAWELAVIRAHGLDKQANLSVQVVELASPEAGKIALRAGNADIIVSDWLWVSRERTLGAKLTFYPYSSALGAVMVPASSPIQTLADLKGRKLAVAGGPIDKNWLLLQAWLKQGGIDLKSEATIAYGAPPLLTAKTLSGEMDATMNYWNFCAVLEAKGFRRVAGIEDLLPKLGAKGRTAMIGYVFDEAWANANQDTVARFIAMTRKAKEILSTSDAEWEKIAPLTGAPDAATLRAYRDRYREGIPRRPIADEEADARILYRVLAGDRRPRTRRAGARTRFRHVLSRDPGRLRCRVCCHSPCLFATWWIASLLVGDAKLPPPPTVLAAMIAEAKSGALFLNLGVTLARVALAFILAMSLGVRHRLPDGPGAACRSDRRSLADPAAQSAGARRHRARLHLGRIDRSRRDCGNCHQQASDRRRHAARGSAGTRRGARRNGDGICVAALQGRSGTSYCRNWRPISQPPRDRDFPWSGRSSWLRSCSDARTALASRLAWPSSCSTSRFCSPIR